MSFIVRTFRLFPVCCPVTYQTGLFEGRGAASNLSLSHWLAVLWRSAVADRGGVFADGEPFD